MTAGAPSGAAAGPGDDGEELLSAREAAAVLGVGVRWVRRARELERIPVVKIGAHVRFRRRDLVAYIAANTTPARPESGHR